MEGAKQKGEKKNRDTIQVSHEFAFGYEKKEKEGKSDFDQRGRKWKRSLSELLAIRSANTILCGEECSVGDVEEFS